VRQTGESPPPNPDLVKALATPIAPAAGQKKKS